MTSRRLRPAQHDWTRRSDHSQRSRPDPRHVIPWLDCALERLLCPGRVSERRVDRTSYMTEIKSTIYPSTKHVTSHARDEPTGSVLSHRSYATGKRPQKGRGTSEGAREVSSRPPGGGGIARSITPPGPVAVARSTPALGAIAGPRRTLTRNLGYSCTYATFSVRKGLSSTNHRA